MTFWYKFEKRWADVFQINPNAIHFNPPQFCLSLSLLSFPVFCLSSSIVLSRYFVISVNSMTTWSKLKLPKIAWPSPQQREHRTENFSLYIYSLHLSSAIFQQYRMRAKRKGREIVTLAQMFIFMWSFSCHSRCCYLSSLILPATCVNHAKAKYDLYLKYLEV